METVTLVLERVEEPVSCEACATKPCPFKVQGCAFDLGNEALAVWKKLDAAGATTQGRRGRQSGVPDELEGVLSKLKASAKACREGIAEKVRQSNKDVLYAERLKRMIGVDEKALNDRVLAAVQASNGHAGNGHAVETPRPSVAAPQAPQAVAIVAPPLMEPTIAVRPVVVAPIQGSARPRKLAADEHVYRNDADRAAEEAIQTAADPNVFGLCISPKVRVENVDKLAEGWKETFSRDPFKGLVAVIPKLWPAKPSVCAVTVYYRGPAQKDATRILKERKGQAPTKPTEAEPETPMPVAN